MSGDFAAKASASASSAGCAKITVASPPASMHDDCAASMPCAYLTFAVAVGCHTHNRHKIVQLKPVGRWVTWQRSSCEVGPVHQGAFCNATT